jgi:uncharacterized membrane protein YoaK (UPF0700 family)
VRATPDVGPEPRRLRPGPVRWVAYAFGARLPERYRSWVLYDTTTSTWVLRHLTRTLVVIAVPIAALLIFLPASFGLRALTAFVTGACVVLLTAILSNDMTERRLMKAGYEWGTGEATRATRSADAQMRTNRQRRERIEARRRRRSG